MGRSTTLPRDNPALLAYLRRLRRLRIDAHLSQHEIARRIGSSQSAVSRRETGVEPADVTFIEAYAIACGADARLWAEQWRLHSDTPAPTPEPSPPPQIRTDPACDPAIVLSLVRLVWVTLDLTTVIRRSGQGGQVLELSGSTGVSRLIAELKLLLGDG